MPQTRTPGGWDQWRGAITHSVETHEKQLSGINGDLRELRASVSASTIEIAAMRVQLIDLQREFKASNEALAALRETDTATLRDEVRKARDSTRNLLLGLLGPLAVGLIVALVVYLLTGHP